MPTDVDVGALDVAVPFILSNNGQSVVFFARIL